MKNDKAENRYVRDQEEKLNLDNPSNYQSWKWRIRCANSNRS
jgi:hypothetical protein